MSDKVKQTTLLGLLTPIGDVFKDIVVPTLDQADSDSVSCAQSIFTMDSSGIDTSLQLRSIFNTLNGNTDDQKYQVVFLGDSGINYPSLECADSSQVLKTIADDINSYLQKQPITESSVNGLLEFLECRLTYVVGSLPDKDVSLLEQAKMTAAISTCLLKDKESGTNSLSEESELFLLYSMDFSGIQDFIYTITSEGALKTLRTRSFYLEILMESIIDDLLSELNLNRVNLIYSGGGHCYMLLPNTEDVISTLEDYNKRINNWLIDTYDISLYVAHGHSACSGRTLMNDPAGSYQQIFRNVSSMISDRKANRYSVTQINTLNKRRYQDYSRECKVCRRVDRVNADGVCSICSSIKDFSKNILMQDVFYVEGNDCGLPLPFGKALSSDPSGAVRSYHKKGKTAKCSEDSVGLWIGDYASDRNTFEAMAKDSKDLGRIERIGVVRADVDNLGSTFSSGFSKNGTENILRTATLSRQLSMFFKYHINTILREKKRNATICYSGGDDLFIVGEWFDVLELTGDIRKCFDKYTQGTLSISAGIGIYDSKYPISRIAYETAEMEDLSKQMPDKDAVTIFSDNTYKWDVFDSYVIGEKYKAVSEFFDSSDSRGMSFLYKLLELLRNRSDKINFARYVYILSRLEPRGEDKKEEKARYKAFSEKMYKWIQSDEDSRQLCTAMMLYVYMTRNKEDQ